MKTLRATCAEIQKVIGMKWPAEFEKRTMKVKWLKDRKGKAKGEGEKNMWDAKLKKAGTDLQCCALGT